MKITKRTQNKLKQFIRKSVKGVIPAAILCAIVTGASWYFNNAEALNRTAVEITDVQPHEVVRCIDGDTFAYGEQTIRLLAIDTPETVKPNTPVEPYGKEASDYTCNVITSAEAITFKQDVGNQKDKYGRTLAWVYVDDVLLQELLVSEGLAVIKYVDKKTVDPIILATLKVAESNAQGQRLNLWSD